MTATSDKLAKAVAAYCTELQCVHACGGATGERSSYGPLSTLLSGVGALLKPKVFCVGELANQGAGHPDFGLYGARQVQRGRPREGQIPERGVVEVKGANDDAWLTAAGDQVSRYWERYRLVLVTNLRHFVLVGEDSMGPPRQAGNLPTGGERRSILARPGKATGLCPHRWRRAGGISVPFPVPPCCPVGTEGSGLAAGLLCP